MGNAGERFDVLDCAGVRTGETVTREAAHAAGVWHGAFHCLIIYPRGGRLRALFQLRSQEKKIAPGRYDVSVGGHYAAGEAAKTAGPREIREELGLIVPFTALAPLGRRIFLFCPAPGVRECEFQDVFLLPMNGPPEGMTLQREEVDAVLELDAEEGIGLFRGDREALAGDLTWSSGARERRFVRRDDFVFSLDGYYLKLLFLARRFHAGERTGLVI